MIHLISFPVRRRSALTAILLSILLGLFCIWSFQSPSSQAARFQLTQQPRSLRPYSPAAPQIAARQMPIGRDGHTATLLPNGKVLVAGGHNPDAGAGGDNSGALNSALLYDPTTGNWTDTGNLRAARFNHVAVPLQNGRVLIAGGQNAGGFLIEAEIYDPGAGQWSATGALNKARARATITLLALPDSAAPNAKALVAGGENNSGYLNSFELYDPATGVWTEPSQKLNVARRDHTATRLSNGSVLIAGGGSSNTAHLDTAEVYDPNSGAWRLTAKKMNSARRLHTATLLTDGKALVAGGSSNGSNALDTCEIYDPAAQTWETLSNRMTTTRRSHSATLMPDGKVLAAFGQSSIAAGGAALNTVEVFDPDTKTWTGDSTRPPGSSPEARINHTATMLTGGRVLLAGGSASTSAVLTSAELYENKGPTTGKWTLTPNRMGAPRYLHTATLLPNGLALVAGGNTSATGAVAATRSAELYNSATGTWTPTGDLNFARFGHTATLLANGKVLVAGGSGNGGPLNTSEIYDPATGAWTPTANTMIAPRLAHTATLLRDGRVLVTGGRSTTTGLRTAEIFNPATGLWSAARDMNGFRQRHTATLLPNGQVLVAGGTVGDGDASSLTTAETYDPITGVWSNTANNMFFPRKGHTATLLPNGKVFVASGIRGGNTQPQNFIGSAEIYDPASRGWSTTNSPQSRIGHTATLLLNGKVMLTGGFTRSDACGEISRFDTDLFDVAAGSVGLVFVSDDLNQPREFHTATLLPNGQVLVAGGRSFTCDSSTGVLTTVTRGDAELFDVGLGDIDLPTRPVITDVTWPGPGNALTAAGIRFQGVSEAAGGGAQSSATNFPIAQLRSLANEQTLTLTPNPAAGRGWTNNNFYSVTVPAGFPPGPAMLTVFANGIPSVAQILAPGAILSQNTISISGRIFDVNGAGFQSTVTLRSSTGLLLTAQTAANGEYVFPNLPARAPAQTAGALTPDSINAGSGGFTLTVDGSGFIAGNSVVLWNGRPRPTTVVSGARVTAAIPSSDLTAPGAVSVVVVTNGVNTSPLIFTVLPQAAAPRPTLTSLVPASATAGDPAFTLMVTGTGFTASSRVRWNGLDRATTFASGTRLTAQIMANDILNPGTANVTVFTPAPGGGLSNALSFTINAPPQLAGSVLLYPFYSSAVSNPLAENTTVTVSNLNAQQSARVKLLFVEGRSGTIPDPLYLNLAPNQTGTFSMSNVDPGVTGYIIAVAVDASDCPIRFNFLRGSENIRLVSGHQATLEAIQIAALSAPPCNLAANSATLNFDGVIYERVPVQVDADDIPSAADGNQTRMILDSLGGDLRLAASGLGQLSGLLFDDAENVFSFSAAESTAQLYRQLSNTFPATVPRFGQLIPAGREGRMRLSPSNRATGPAIFGAVLRYNPNGTLPITGGYLLRATDFKPSHTLIIPKIPLVGFSGRTLGPDALTLSPTIPSSDAAPRDASAKGDQTAPPATASPDLIAQQGGAITYTMTPSGTANNGQPVAYSPASRTVNTAPSGPSFSSSVNQTGGFNNQDFWAQYATLSISGAISGLNGATPDVKLQLLSHASYIPVPNDQKERAAQPNNLGGYQFEQCFISGLYKITPMSPAFTFLPADIPLLPLTMNQIGLNFAASGACQPPGVAAQPASQSVCSGAPASFSVTPSGTGPFSYQWRKNGVAIGGATGASYSIALANPGDAGNYDVVISNACGMVTSGAATLTVNTFSLSETNASFPASGGSGSVNVIATVSQCGWAATSSAAWIVINSGSSGVGNGVINYSVAANSDPNSRSGAITLGGQSFLVIFQSGAAPQQNFEADVSPRPAGNGSLTISDWVLVGRFVTGLDAPAIGSEFQRADSAPRPCGNGVLTIADWVQAGRYAAGLDPPTPPCGPTEPAMASTYPPRDARGEMIERLRAPNPRMLRLTPDGVAQEAMRSVVIAFDALGGENALGFSVNFDAARWRIASITERASGAQARLIVNTQQASSGRVGFALALPADRSWDAGRHELAVINFASLAGADAELMGLGFADQPVAREVVDAQANLLSAGYTLEGARPLAIASAASFDPSALASESIASAFGLDLVTTTLAADTLPLPTQLGGAQVIVRDSRGVERPAPMFFVSPGQINFLIPAETAIGPAVVIVSNERGDTASGVIEIVAAAPALFSVDASGQGSAAGVVMRVRSDGSSSYEPIVRFDAARQRFIAAPIDLERDPAEEVFLLLFGSGFRHLASEISVIIGGERAEVIYAGPQGDFAGLDQINARLPRNLVGRGEAELILTVGGRAANPLKLHIK